MNFSRYLLRLRHYEYVEVGVFWRGWVTFSQYFRWKATIASNHCWSQKKLERFFVGVEFDRRLFRFVTMHAFDGRTEFRQQERALHYMQSLSKKRSSDSDMTCEGHSTHYRATLADTLWFAGSDLAANNIRTWQSVSEANWAVGTVAYTFITQCLHVSIVVLFIGLNPMNFYRTARSQFYFYV